MTTYIIICVLIGVLLGLIYCWYFSPTQKGKRGEKKVNKILQKISGSLYTNYLIKDERGSTHQIDSVFVNKSGVFVVETKNYAGRIYGSDHTNQWTQVLNYGKVKNHFYSPVKQNQTHVNFIKNIVGQEVPVYNIVIFVRDNIKYIESTYVLKIKKLSKFIESKQAILSDEEYQRVIKDLEDKRDLTTTDKEHIKNVKKIQSDIENNICPRCGGKLVKRKSKDGRTFIGCSNYPKCHFIKKD